MAAQKMCQQEHAKLNMSKEGVAWQFFLSLNIWCNSNNDKSARVQVAKHSQVQTSQIHDQMADSIS